MNARNRFLLAAATLGMAAGCSAGRETGQMAPDFKLDSLDGQSVSLSQYMGNVVLLSFWAVG